MSSENSSTIKTAITGLTLTELTRQIAELGKEAYRAKQIFQWLYQKNALSFEEMTNLSKPLREFLAKNYYIPRPQLTTQQDSPEDKSRKFLFSMSDQKTVETVLIPGKDRLTQCVSSQVGCAMACDFCNTGDMGLMRNLKTHEIVDQILEALRLCNFDQQGLFGHKLSNIVFMGMGEPFHNYDAVVDAIEILTSDFGLGLSHRKITVSTSGIVPKIIEFGFRSKGNLAISLNATTDELRDKIMPVNKRWPLKDLLEACRNYPLRPNRRITFEYVLLDGLNNSMDDAKRILKLLQGIPSKVNLIPYNPHPASPYKRPALESCYKFQKYLLDRGLHTTIRISKGKDILAACGQLRSQEATLSRHNERRSRAKVV